MSLAVKATIKGAEKLYRDIGIENKKQKRALHTAIKVEGFNRLKEMREAIRAGKPGGHPYADQLSKIARRTKRGTLKKNQVPLYRLARLLRYHAEYDGHGNLKVSFGFKRTGPRRLNSYYQRLVQLHQAGEDVFYTGSRTELGRRFARIGGKLKKKGDSDAQYFFLRKETGRKIHLPGRQIVKPYWADKKDDAVRNIRRNFRRKLAGHRI